MCRKLIVMVVLSILVIPLESSASSLIRTFLKFVIIEDNPDRKIAPSPNPVSIGSAVGDFGVDSASQPPANSSRTEQTGNVTNETCEMSSSERCQSNMTSWLLSSGNGDGHFPITIGS